MDEASQLLAKDPTTPDYVLSKYLELFNSDYDFFQFFIAPNGVLEWFGRTVKGNKKIHDFLRYEVCSQYDHLLFESARNCEPFKCKTTHVETNQFPTEIETPITTDTSFAGDTTTFESVLSTTVHSAKDRRGSITPPSSPKRLKYEDDQPLNNSFLPMLKIEDYFDRKDSTITPVTNVSTSVTASTSSNVKYSDLKYIETTGILRSSTQPEHRSYKNSSSINMNGCWDRETKILISYRIRLHDNDIQFALIIYKNVHPYTSVSKRNLMSEFDEVSTQKKIATNNNESSTRTTAQQMRRKIGRRLRLL